MADDPSYVTQQSDALDPWPVTSGPAAPPLTHRNLPMLLLLARERLLARFRPLLSEHGLTEQQWRIMRVVHDAGSLEQRQVMIACGMSGPSLAGILSRMQALDLVTRTRVAQDQRRVEVRLTDRSRLLVAELAPRIEAVYRAIEERIGPEVASRLEGDLDRILNNLGNR